jgi:hypothetical protein
VILWGGICCGRGGVSLMCACIYTHNPLSILTHLISSSPNTNTYHAPICLTNPTTHTYIYTHPSGPLHCPGPAAGGGRGALRLHDVRPFLKIYICIYMHILKNTTLFFKIKK